MSTVQSEKRRAQRVPRRDPVERERECQKSAKSSCQKLFTHRRMRPSPKSRIEFRGVIHHKVELLLGIPLLTELEFSVIQFQGSPKLSVE